MVDNRRLFFLLCISPHPQREMPPCSLGRKGVGRGSLSHSCGWDSPSYSFLYNPFFMSTDTGSLSRTTTRSGTEGVCWREQIPVCFSTRIPYRTNNLVTRIPYRIINPVSLTMEPDHPPLASPGPVTWQRKGSCPAVSSQAASPASHHSLHTAYS